MLAFQICAGLQSNDLKIRKLSGDNTEYTNLCKELLAGENEQVHPMRLHPTALAA